MISTFKLAGRLLFASCLCLAAAFCRAQTPTNVTVLPNVITAGESTTGMVALSAPTSGARTITLSSDTNGVNVPATVSVAAGKQSASFKVTSTTGLKTTTATLTASLGGGSAVGFVLVQAASIPIPAFRSLTFAPSVALGGQKITGLLSFTQPLLVSMTFNLTSQNLNFAVPSSIRVPGGSKSFPFNVSPSSSATTGMGTVTATLADGDYQDVFSGSTSVSGAFTFVADGGLPPNYRVGLWVSSPFDSHDGGDGSTFRIETLKTYADGRLWFGEVNFYSDPNGSEPIWSEYDYLANGHVSPKGNLEMDSISDYLTVFYHQPARNQFDGPTFPALLFDRSTLTFSNDGKSMQLALYGSPHTWNTSRAVPTIAFGSSQLLGTFNFTRVE